MPDGATHDMNMLRQTGLLSDLDDEEAASLHTDFVIN
jgi:hypothetical protein